jgi:hypothetical protein
MNRALSMASHRRLAPFRALAPPARPRTAANATPRKTTKGAKSTSA